MPVTVEREIKLRFCDPVTARAAVIAAGATPMRARRLQDDSLLDTVDESLRRQRCVLRVRVESGKSIITFKGPVQPALTKVREELETIVGDGEALLRILDTLGYRVWFRYQKYREEFSLDEVIIAVDETPVGTFIEIEGGDRGIHGMAGALGRTTNDYVLDSYRRIYFSDCEARGIVPSHMIFED
jgi:adenylate cyclase, class 2